MKKIVAMLMALCMMLSCTALAAPAEQTTAQVYINPQLFAGMPEETLTLIDTINSLEFKTTEGENYITCAYGANGTQIEEYTVAATDDGSLVLLSSLYPNTAVVMDFAKLMQMLETVLPADVLLEAVNLVNGLEGLIMSLSPYMQDVNALLTQLETEMYTDETGAMYLEITSQHLGTLVDAWITRLYNDMKLYAVLQDLYAMMTADDVNAPTLLELLEMLKYEAGQLKTAEPMVLSTVGVFANEGATSVEITLANQLLLGVDIYEYEGMSCVDVLLLTCLDGSGEWQTAYDGVFNGSNYSDVVLGLSCAYDPEYTYTELYMVSGGQMLSATLENYIENAGTADQKVTTMMSIDMAEGENVINLGGIAGETVLVEDAGMPSLEDKYVLDLMALPFDLLMNGLPQYAENIVAAMPEAVQLVIDALAQVEGLEFLQDITVITEEPADADVTEADVADNEWTEEITSGDLNEIVEADLKPSGNIEEAQTATEAPVQPVADDEIAPLEAPKMDGVIEDM